MREVADIDQSGAISRFRLSSSRLDSFPLHAVFLIALALPYCINLGASSLWDANEAFYAETPREMLISGDWLAPRFNFVPRAQKPPLTYWVILFSYQLFGVNEFALRLPSALAAIGTFLFCYGAGRMLFGPRAALAAAAIAATTPRIFILERRLPIDIILLFFLTGTLFFLLRALLRNETRSWSMVYLCIGLGILTKGPIALVIPAGAYALWGVYNRRLRLSDIRPWLGFAMLAAVVLPWYILIYRAHGWMYIAPFFLRDNLGRFAAETFGPSRGFHYYAPVFLADFFPWSFLSLGALVVLWLRRKTESPLKNPAFGLPLFWCGLIFVLFSLSKNKQEYYIAPMYPAASLLLAGVLERTAFALRDRAAGWRSGWFLGICRFAALLTLVIGVSLPYVCTTFMPHAPPMLHYGPSLLVGAGAGLLIWRTFARKPGQSLAALSMTFWCIFALSSIYYVPALETWRPVKSLCRTIERVWAPGDEAGYFRTALPSMVFYLRRPIFEESDREQMLRRFESSKRVFCVLSREDFAYFVTRSELDLHIVDRRPRFALRFRDLLNSRSFSGEELLLVSNRPQDERWGETMP